MYKFNQKTLLWEIDEEKQFKYDFFKNATIGVIVTFLIMVLYFDAEAQKQRDTVVMQKSKIKLLQTNLDSLLRSKDLPLTLATVDWVIDLLPFKDKLTVKKQYRIESGNLKAPLVITNKNLLGMRNAGKRPQPGCKSKFNDYRHYDHWIFSIFDRYIYEIYNGTSLKGYAEDEKYFDKLKIKK